MALSILRARSLLVRLIHSLNTPAIAAAGGPRSLLNLTRLLAAQDLANGSVPTSVWSSADSLQGSQQLEIGYATGEVQGTDHSVLQHNDKVVGAAHLDQDSLLKVGIVQAGGVCQEKGLLVQNVLGLTGRGAFFLRSILSSLMTWDTHVGVDPLILVLVSSCHIIRK